MEPLPQRKYLQAGERTERQQFYPQHSDQLCAEFGGARELIILDHVAFGLELPEELSLQYLTLPKCEIRSMVL